jgi:hypothetical protein
VDYWDWAARQAFSAPYPSQLAEDASAFWRLAAERTQRSEPLKLGGRLTLSERRWILLLGDLLIINAALVAAGMMWQDPAFSLATVLPKWFVTLSLVWLGLGFTLDIYDPARAASGANSLINSGIAALRWG